MEYRNTTDIPTDLVKVVIAFAAQSGVELKRLELRNKEAGLTHGQFGWYFHDKRIRLIVPQEIPPKGLMFRLKFYGRTIHIRDRVEFVVAVLAHELRHAWQIQTQLQFASACTAAKEFDAEQYEYEMLNKWRNLVNENTTIK